MKWDWLKISVTGYLYRLIKVLIGILKYDHVNKGTNVVFNILAKVKSQYLLMQCRKLYIKSPEYSL